MSHSVFMHRCLELAARGRKHTGVNPMVGAVLVRDGLIIAEGWHAAYGQLHAEQHLLMNYDQKLYSKDTLYVNLEPCCHTKKKTPPCTDMILARGVGHVIYGMKDPNPFVAGKGIALLQSKGVRVEGPVEPVYCERLNRGFLSFISKDRPWVTLKKAQMLSGAVHGEKSERLFITNDDQNTWSHEYLRSTHDAILVGVGTVNADDPQLTVRLSNTKIDHINPFRIVLDSNMSIQESSQILHGELANGTWIICGEKALHAKQEKVALLQGRGVKVCGLPTGKQGHIAWNALWKLLTTPTQEFYGITSLLVEGGPSIWQSFRENGMVDEEVILVGN